MAYQQQQQYNDHYNHLVPDPLPTQQPYSQAPAGGYHQQGYDDNQNWETKSYKSYNSQYASSQAHLNPQYDNYQPPMPQVSYNQPAYQQQQVSWGQQPQGYPPAPSRQYSSGYSAAQEKMLKRRSVRQVELQQGNLVLDVPVPSNIVPTGETSEERTKMRYTAATCDPDDFMRSKYSLRPYLLGRQTELFIVMTM